VDALPPAKALLAESALPLMESLDRLVGDPVVAALLQVAAAGFGAERPLGVGDPVALAVLLDAGEGLPQGALPLDRGGWLPKLSQPTGLLQFDRPDAGPAAPGQHPGQLPFLGDGIGVAFQPALAALLRLPGDAFAVGSAVGLLPGEPLSGVGEGELLTRLDEFAAVE
jgi:hypothetical protein